MSLSVYQLALAVVLIGVVLLVSTDAIQPVARTAMRAALIPTIAAMMTVGVVQLPGMMTGQVLAGASPLTAIEYQIVVMFMQAAGSALASLLFVRLAARRYLTPAHQLRCELLVR